MPQPPKALLFIATGCQHCPTVLQALSELVKAGEISQLEIINIQHAPDKANEYLVRSVPWVKIGPFELVGLRSKTELQQWIKRVDDTDAMADYFSELMLAGEIKKVHQMLEKNPETFSALIQLIGNEKTTLSVRIGVGAVIEEFSGSKLLKQYIPSLAKLTHHYETRIRNDACYYLGLSHDEEARQYIEPLLNDNDAEVREIAEEALEELT